MRAGWSEAKLAEWKAGWKAKSANWKKKKGRQAPAQETLTGEVLEPHPKRKRKNKAESRKAKDNSEAFVKNNNSSYLWKDIKE